MKASIYLTLFSMFLLFACKSNKIILPKEVEEALELAEENRNELEKVIHFFSKLKKDSLKLKSTYFLISNMPFHKSHLIRNESTCLMQFIELADKKLYEIYKNQPIDSLKSEFFQRKVDKIRDFVQIKMMKKQFKESISRLPAMNDIKVINSVFLINHIENAFTLKETPIVELLSFDDFCENILPYRLIDDKYVTKTGKDYKFLFYKYLKTDTNNEDDIMDTLERFKLIIGFFRKILGNYPYSEKLGFEELFFNTPRYDCFDMVNTQGLILNACGIPVQAIYNLSFKNRSGSHAFLSLPQKYTGIGGFIPEDYVRNKKSQYFLGYSDRTNFYRLSFSLQDNSPKKISNEYIPTELSSECIEDVSSNWCPINSIRLPFKRETNNKLAYLATFNVDRGIICTTWGIIDKELNIIDFPNGLPNTLYFPVYIDGLELKLFGRPFYYRVDSLLNSSFEYFDKKKETLNTVHLLRKYPIKPATIIRAKNLIGTTVIASANEDFREADTLYTLTQQLGIYYQDMELNNKKAYKYYKIEAPPEKPYMTITEIEYLTKKEYGYKNTITPIPLPVFKYDDLKVHREKSFLVKLVDTCIHSNYAEYDGNEMTARYGINKIVVKLSNPQIINAIRFSPMNARNGVYPENLYTLHMWKNDQWVVVRNVTAQFNYLLFDNLKTNTLYWLKNRTEGREELPFLINKEGVQNFLYFDIK